MGELDKLIKQARVDVAKGSLAVRICQKRVDKFKDKHKKAKHQVNYFKKHKKPKKVEFWQKRQARAARKIRYWTKREADAIENNKSFKARLSRLLRKKAASQPNGKKLVDKAASYIGTREGGAQQRQWANNLGYSSYLPWCSIFVANMLLEAGIDTKSQLPSNPAYSGAWIGWGRGRRVNRSEVQPGDLLIFDWGDGGLTDHVAIYAGSGHHIGGNQSNAVTKSYTPWGNVVAVIRPL